MEICIGMRGEASTLIEREDTALEVGSGSLLVYATPCMASLMEGAACAAIAEALDDNTTSVGTALNLHHTAATPVGLEVHATAEVTSIDGRVITFHITVHDDVEEIGTADHTRVLVNKQRFLDKAYRKI